MSSLLRAFDERLAELGSYYTFVESIERDASAATLAGKVEIEARWPVDEKVLRILKANCFLLIYNLVEASIREGFAALYDAVHADSCSVRQLSLQLRQVWIDFEYSKIKPSTANPDSYREVGRRLVESVAGDTLAKLDVAALNFGGNLDARAIRKVCDEHGVSHEAVAQAKGGETLLLVKNKRNALAHGEESFIECGRDYTVSQLKEILDEATLYLKDILVNIQDFAARKGYRT